MKTVLVDLGLLLLFLFSLLRLLRPDVGLVRDAGVGPRAPRPLRAHHRPGLEEGDLAARPPLFEGRPDADDGHDAKAEQFDAPSHELGEPRIYVVQVMVVGVIGPGLHGDEDDDDRRDHNPAGLPVVLHERPRLHAHLLDVLPEPLGPVEPADRHQLDEGHEQNGIGGTVVHQLEEEEPGVEADGEAGQESHGARADHDEDAALSQSRKLVHDRRDQGLPGPAHRGDGEQDQHEEEHEAEERADGHGRDGLGVDDKRQSGAGVDHALHGHLLLECDEPDDAKHHEASINGGQAVADPDQEGVSMAVGAEPVVRGQQQLAADGNAQAVEDLTGRVVPHV